MSGDSTSPTPPTGFPIEEQLCQEWLGVGLCTAPADRRSAERGVETLYRQLGLRPPERVVWLQSPFAGMLAALLVQDQRRLLHVRRRVRRVRRKATWRAVRRLSGSDWNRATDVLDPVAEQIWRQVRLTVYQAVRSDVGAQTDPAWLHYVWKQLHDQGGLSVAWRSPQAVWAKLWAPQMVATGLTVFPVAADPRQEPTGFGQHDAAWLSRHRLSRRIAGLAPAEELSGLEAIARSSGWWWGFPDLAILTERPAMIRRDVEHRLHAESEPAVSYNDNYGVWAWHGVAVNHAVLEHPERMSARAIAAIRDRTVRRVLVERYGYGRFMQNLEDFNGGPWWRPQVRNDVDDYGTLWRVRLRREEPLQVVQVTDATPQPDGRRKEYFLRVPPSVRTAREAVAWTFNREVEEYIPIIQT